jgi:hypothetical protein
MTDAAAEHLSRCNNLQSVNFESCANLTQGAAEKLRKTTQLQAVKFTYCPSATDATESCAKCPQLIGTEW